ncbi:halovibrin HvnA [Pseudomonas sichuanensis]|uniref:halovibrin HvnA n=1 Tax=Pseudomonas sichuanensis TaxID=2213015 RepID=UPI000DA671AE|nr:halovibrin HvnA [Pseudomonas sichuanensis]
MKRLITLLMFFALTMWGCAEHPTISTKTQSGPEVAAALNARYLSTVSNCGSGSAPAFLCSGVILRSTVYSDAYDSWDPSPGSHRQGSVSFSYLRRDNNFDRFWSAKNGLVFYPIFETPAGKLKLPILCFFPIDGGSDNRAEHRCGAYPGIPESDKCDRLGIYTAEQYVAKYPPTTGWGRTCGWDVRDELNQYAVQNFNEGMRSKRLDTGYFTVWNELVVQAWSDDADAQVPIQAFFYMDSVSLTLAKKDKEKYRTKTGIIVPLIQLRLPTTPSETATFAYLEADQ